MAEKGTKVVTPQAVLNRRNFFARKYYLYEVTLGVYMLSKKERIAFSKYIFPFLCHSDGRSRNI